MGGSALIGVLGLLLAALMLFAQAYAPAPEPRTPAERRALNLRVFDKVWEAVDRRYYDRTFHGVDWRKTRAVWRPRAADMTNSWGLYWLVLHNMLAQLQDGHTQVAEPSAPSRALEATSSTGARSRRRSLCPGVDLFLGATTAGGLNGLSDRVLDVRRGTPADAAGVEPGWRIGNVNVSAPSSGCRWITQMEVRDDDGHLHLVRGDAPPPEPPPPPHSARTLPGGARLLAFTSFVEEPAHWLLGELAHAPPQGVVFDLRRNGGGDEFALKIIAGALLGPGAPLGEAVTRGSAHQWRSAPLSWWRRLILNDHAPEDRRAYRGPLIVLVGPATASAAELLADAVQHEHRGLIVGDRTAGSVLLAKHVRLRDGGTLSISIADVRGASGRRLEGVGVAPDVPVRQTLAAIRAGRDLTLEAAEARLAGRR